MRTGKKRVSEDRQRFQALIISESCQLEMPVLEVLEIKLMLKRRVVEGISVCVVILETGGADESFLRELLSMLSRRTDFHAIKVHQGLTSGSSEREVLTFPDLEIHLKEETVYKNGRLIPMGHYEFVTLCFLAKHPGWVFSKQQIYEAVWQEPEGDGSSAIANIVSRIRKKLNPDNPKDGYIKTVVNGGYKFEV